MLKRGGSVIVSFCYEHDGCSMIASAGFVLRNTVELDLDNTSERTCFYPPPPICCCAVLSSWYTDCWWRNANISEGPWLHEPLLLFISLGRIQDCLSKCSVSCSSKMVPHWHNFIIKYPSISKLSHLILSYKQQELSCSIRLLPSPPSFSSHCVSDVTWRKWQTEIQTFESM